MKSFLPRYVVFSTLYLSFVWFFLLVYRWATWRWVYYTSVANENENLITSFYLGGKFDLRLVLISCAPIVLLSLFFHKHFFNSTAWSKFVTVFSVVVFFLLNFFYAVDIGNYFYLNERVNASILSFLTNPLISSQMMWQTYPVVKVFIALLAITYIQVLGVKFIYKKSSGLLFENTKTIRAVYTILFLLLSVFAGYGKLSYYPLRWSEAFFSKNNDLSQLTLNPILYFVNSLKFNETTFDLEQAKLYYPTVAKYLGANPKESLQFARTYTPLNDSIPEPVNVVVVMMESLGAQPLGVFNNPLKGTPFIDSLATNSWFLPNFYVPRYGTARTVFASISGLPDVVEVKTASRNPKIINQKIVLDQFKGHEKLYFLGGSANWANIRALFTNNISGIKIYEEGTYKNEDRVDVWGINDGDLFRNANQTLSELNKKKKPFVAYVQSSGYHMPYTVPDSENGYKPLTTKEVSEADVKKAGFTSLAQFNSLRYFDHNLKLFFELAKKSGYYKNTVFVLFGDHNSGVSLYNHMEKPEYETGLGQLHVPLIIHGEMLPKMVDKRMANLMDVYPTIADLLNKPYTNYTLGRSLLRRPLKDESPSVVFENYQGNLSSILIYPNHYYYGGKKGNEISSEMYFYKKSKKPIADKSYTKEKLRTIDSLAKGLYQSTLYLYFNNKK